MKFNIKTFTNFLIISCSPVTYLALDQHGHVNKHVMQLADAVFQLDDLGVSGLDLVQGLLGHLRVHFDLQGEDGL